MSFRIRSILVAVLTLALLAMLIATVLSLMNTNSKLADAEASRYRVAGLADQVRDGSNNLTRMARTYVATKDAKYLNYYHRIIDIRKGTASRPASYGGIFWDIVTASGALPYSAAPTISLRNLFEEMNLTDRETVLFREVERLFGDLFKLEERAFNALIGKFPDASGAYTRLKAPDQVLATRLLHQADYHKAKLKVLQSVALMLAAVDARALEQTAYFSKLVDFHHTILFGLGVITFLVIALASWSLLRHFVIPVDELVRVSERIRKGEVDQRAADLTGNDEINGLNRAFNQMADQASRSFALHKDKAEEVMRLETQAGIANKEFTRIKAELDEMESRQSPGLQENTHQLSAIISNSSAIISLKDVDGRYKMVNPRYEAFFGLVEREIIGQTDYDLFEKDFADTSRKYDMQVLEKLAATEVAETVPHDGQFLTIISTRFPVFDSEGGLTAICRISIDISLLDED
jgi:PAS domain S-box-containing protein